MSEYQLFLFNFIAYLTISLLSYLRFKGNLIFSKIWLWWAISSLTTIYFVFEGQQELYKIEIWPFLYIIMNLFFITWPFLYLKTSDIRYENLRESNKYVSWLDKLPKLLFIILLLPTIENFILSLSLQANNLEALYNRADSGVDTYHRLSFYSRNANRIVDYIFYIVPFLIFRELSKEKLNRNIIFFLSIVMLDILLSAYNLAARTEFVKIILCFLSYYIFFRHVIPVHRLKIIQRWSIIVLSCFTAAMLIITMARFSSMDTDNNIFVWLSLYFGEGFYRFANLMWYMNDAQMWGDDNFPLIKSILGFDTFNNQLDRMDYWTPKVGIPCNIFYTFIGNFVFDFGFYGATLLSIVLGLCINYNNFAMKKKLYYYHIVIFSVFTVMLFFGIMHFVYKVWCDQYRLLGLLLFALLLRRSEKSNKINIYG